jgi:hypothetical protein
MKILSRVKLALGNAFRLWLPWKVGCSLTSEKLWARSTLLDGGLWTRRSEWSRWMYPWLWNAWWSSYIGIGWWLRHGGRHWFLLWFHSILLDSLLLLNANNIIELVT